MFLRNLLITIAVLIGIVLWQIDRGIPQFARKWLERAMSSDRFAIRFDQASFNIFGEITARNVRISLKHSLDPPLGEISELRAHWKYRAGMPPYTWIHSVEAKNALCRPFRDLPDSTNGTSFAEYLRRYTIERDLFSEPIGVTLDNVDIFTVKCRKLKAEISARQGVLIVNDINADILSRKFAENISGNLTYQPNPCRINSRLQGSIMPESVEKLIDFLGGDTANEYAASLGDFSSPLKAEGEIHWKSALTENASAEQNFKTTLYGSNLSYNGLPLNDINLALEWYSSGGETNVQKCLTIAPLVAHFKDGSLSAEIGWSPTNHATKVHAETDMPPNETAMVIWNKIPKVFTNFTFTANSHTIADGVIFPHDKIQSTVVTGSFQTASATARGYPLEDVSFDYSFHDGNALDFTNIVAKAFGGDLTGHLDLLQLDDREVDGAEQEDEWHMLVEASLRNADFAKIRRHFGAQKVDDGGLVDGDVKLDGIADSEHLDTLVGNAEFKVRNGNILRIPLFIWFTDFIGRNVPGMDLLLMETDSDISCTLTNGLVNIDHFSVSGNLFSMVAKGKCRINKQGIPLNLTAQIRFFHSQSLVGRLTRLVTMPVSKLMEFKITGPLSQPDWSYIGLYDRIRGLFVDEEDATALTEEGTEAKDTPEGKEPQK